LSGILYSQEHHPQHQQNSWDHCGRKTGAQVSSPCHRQFEVENIEVDYAIDKIENITKVLAGY
jgi:hypothetical protein